MANCLLKKGIYSDHVAFGNPFMDLPRNREGTE